MIQYFYFEGAYLKAGVLAPGHAGEAAAPPIWLDLLAPDMAAIGEVDRAYALDLPTQEEMQEIETSSRLYEEGGSLYMTITYIANSLGDKPETTQLTFVVKDSMLVTIRHKDMRILNHIISKLQSRGHRGEASGIAIMLMILEGIIDLCSDVLEKNHAAIEGISQHIFDQGPAPKDYKASLKQIAAVGDLNSKIRESLVSLSRQNIFLSNILERRRDQEHHQASLRTFMNDIHSLLDHAAFVSGKIAFLLDATLGLVNIEQNAIIKIFSVAAVIFLPPTLIASIYGMNFQHMPELPLVYGYPLALLLMVVSAALPFWYFKYKKWL